MSEKKKRAKLKPSKLVVSIFLIIFIFLIVFVVAQTLRGVPFANTTQGISDFFDSLSAGPGYPYARETADVEDVATLDDQLVVLSNDETYLLNTTAKETTVNNIHIQIRLLYQRQKSFWFLTEHREESN